jgi:hypothetical protein
MSIIRSGLLLVAVLVIAAPAFAGDTYVQGYLMDDPYVTGSLGNDVYVKGHLKKTFNGYFGHDNYVRLYEQRRHVLDHDYGTPSAFGDGFGTPSNPWSALPGAPRANPWPTEPAPSGTNPWLAIPGTQPDDPFSVRPAGVPGLPNEPHAPAQIGR